MGKVTAQQRVLRVFCALRGHSVTGISNGEIAKSVGDSPANVTRALSELIDAGLATKLENGRFAHSVMTLQIAVSHMQHVEKVQLRLSEMQQRVAAGAIN